MTPEEKVLRHYMRGITLLTFEERKEILEKVLKEKSLRKLSKEMGVPLTTLHGWKTGRNMYRSDKIIKEISTLNQKLKMVLDILSSIKKIDNTIAEDYMNKIKEEIKKLS